MTCPYNACYMIFSTRNVKQMENIVSIKKFAELLDKSENTVRTWKTRGEIPPSIFFKIGASIFVKLDKFYKWVDERKTA